MDEHLGFCIKTVIRNQSSNQSLLKINDNFHFGEALESVYPLLEIIFSYLCDRDLENVVEVKNSWGDIAKKLLLKRSKISWISCYHKNRNNNLNYSDNLHHNNASIGVFLYDYKRLKLGNYVCLHKDANLERMTFAEYLGQEIVNNAKVNYCLLSCPKVVSFFKDDHFSNGSVFDGILLPEIPGIRTTMFYSNPHRLRKDPSLLNTYIKSEEQFMCILLFALSDLHKSINNFIKILLKDCDAEDVAIGGGVIRGTKPFQNSQDASKKVFRNSIGSSDILSIVFLKEKYSNPDFNAASCVIEGNEFSNQEFHEEVEKFSKKVIIRRNSFGFRICCGAKCNKDEESLIFRKHFPETPLLGLEADGEIGWNCYNLKDQELSQSKMKKPKLYPKLQHQWSTVFVIITWGDIVGEQ